MTFLPVVTRDLCEQRLQMIFPREAFAPQLSGAGAGAAVAGLIWAGCVMADDSDPLGPDLPYARPTTTLWMNADLITIDDSNKRRSWHKTSTTTKARARKLQVEWDVETEQWYADNSRETVRDDFFIPWTDYGAMLGAPHIPTTSPKPRWILRRSFAELFDPDLQDEALDHAISDWTNQFMSAAGRVRANLARSQATAAASVRVNLPDGGTRDLSPGKSSILIQGVIEGWATLRLRQPAVLAISESGDKINFVDAARLRSTGIAIDVSNLLPDLLLVDVDTDTLTFWIIEVVATVGPINERRKEKLLKWADSQGIPENQVEFLTAFLSRNHGAAKKFLPEIASGTHVWFLDEPENELSWGPLPNAIPDNVVPIGR